MNKNIIVQWFKNMFKDIKGILIQKLNHTYIECEEYLTSVCAIVCQMS